MHHWTCQNNLSKTWNIIKNKLACGNISTVTSLIVHGIETKDEEVLTGRFNDYFINTGLTLATNKLIGTASQLWPSSGINLKIAGTTIGTVAVLLS